MPNWDQEEYGAGLLNVEALLAEPLPDLLFPLAFEMQAHTAIDNGNLATFNHLFEGALKTDRPQPGQPGAMAAAGTSSAQLRTRLAELLGTSVAELDHKLREVGQEAAFHLATDPELYALFERSLMTTHAPVVEDAAGVGPTPRTVPDQPINAVRARLSVRASETLKATLSSQR